MSIKAVNSLSHYTDWTIGHVHSGALGWVGMITFGAIYYLVPRLWNRERLYSLRLVNWHFWLATSASSLYAAGDVGLRHHAGPDVARIRPAGFPRLLLRRDRRGHASLLRDPRASAASCILVRRAAHGLEHLARPSAATIRARRRPAPGRAPVASLPNKERDHGSDGQTRDHRAQRHAAAVARLLVVRSAASSRSRRSSTSRTRSRRSRACGPTRRSNSPAATSTSARAATSATAR